MGDTQLRHFYDLLNKSKMSIIGYSFRHERYKDKLLSQLPYLNISEKIDHNFNIKSFFRNDRIDKVLTESKNFDYLVIDNYSMSYLDRKYAHEFIDNFLSMDTDKKLILTFNIKVDPIYDFATQKSDIYFQKSYLSAVLQSHGEDYNKHIKLKIIKNRYGPEFTIDLSPLN